MKKALILVLSFSTITGFAQNQSKYTFTLKEAQEYAKKNAYTVVDKELEYEKSKKQILETAAIGLPQVSFSADYTYNSQLAATPLPDGFATGGVLDGQPDLVTFGVEHQTTATLNVNQLIFDASYIVALRATRVVKDITSLNTEKAKIDIDSEIAKTYYLVAVSKENQKVTKESVETIRKNLFEVQEYYKNGLLEEQDADQIEILLLTQENALRNLDRAVKIAENLLKFQMGMPISEQVSFTDNLDMILESSNTESDLLQEKFDKNNHIDYRIIEAQRLGAKLQLQNQRNTFYPNLSGFLRHTESNFGNDQFNAFQFDRYWVPGTALGLSLKWNLFQGMGRTARIQQARIDLDRVDVAIKTTNSNLELQYDQNKSNFEFALDNYNTQKRNMELSQRIRDKTRIKYREGISTSLDLTQTENQYSQAQGAFFQAVLDLLNAKEELAKHLESKHH